MRGLTTGMSILTLIAILLVVGSFFVLWRTAFGLRLRSCGENPVAAESLGVNVYSTSTRPSSRPARSPVSAGVFLARSPSSAYREGQTGGRGFIGLAAMIFGNWRPGGLLAGSALFGYTDALQLRRGGESVHALLLVLLLDPAGPGGVAGAAPVEHRDDDRRRRVRRRRCWSGTCSPTRCRRDFTGMTPYVATLLVLSLAAQRLRMPAADGLPYRRGEGG